MRMRLGVLSLNLEEIFIYRFDTQQKIVSGHKRYLYWEKQNKPKKTMTFQKTNKTVHKAWVITDY